MQLNYTIRPRTIGIFLTVVALYLAIQSAFGEFLQTNVIGTDSVPALLLDLFSVNAEQAIPTWYSVLLLLTAAFLLFLIGFTKRDSRAPYAIHWIGLACIFLYLSIDEGSAIHEIATDPLRTLFQTSGYLSFAWLIIAVPLVVGVGLLYLRFLLHLPAHTRNGFILAGALYVGGAVLVEAMSANQLSVDQQYTWAYLALGSIEELCEMLGIVAFIYALLSYAAEMQYSVLLGFLEPQATGNQKVLLPSPRLVLPLLVIVLIFNAALAYWGITQKGAPVTAEQPAPAASFYQTIIEQYATDQMTVAYIADRFSLDNLLSRQFAASLLTTFDNVMVIVFPADQSSIYIAGANLPFDYEGISELLREHGQMQFIVYDSGAVKTMVEDIENVADVAATTLPTSSPSD